MNPINFNNEHFEHNFETESYEGICSYRFYLNEVVNEQDKVILYGDFYQAAHIYRNILPCLSEINEETSFTLDEDDHDNLEDEVESLCACFKLKIKVTYDRDKLENIFNKKHTEIVDALIKEECVSEPIVWFGYNTRDENLGNDELYTKLKNRPKELVDYIKQSCINEIYDDYEFSQFDRLYTKPLQETIMFKF